MIPPLQDRDWLVERKCTDIRGGDYGTASLVYGYQRDTKKRLYIMRSGEHVARFHMSARASSAARRDAMFQRQSELMRLNPDGAIDLACVIRSANPHGIFGAQSSIH